MTDIQNSSVPDEATQSHSSNRDQAVRPGPQSKSEENAGLKLLLEAGPLIIFFICNSFAEQLIGVTGSEKIFWATGAFMIATAVSLTASRALLGEIPLMPLVSGVFILGFGAITLALQDDFYIKIKPTVVNLIFAAALLTGLLFGQLFLKILLGTAINMRDEGWRILTIRWALFFCFLAILNEIIWRSFSTDFWAGFKLFGVMPITLVFAASQVGLLMKYQIEEEVADDAQNT